MESMHLLVQRTYPLHLYHLVFVETQLPAQQEVHLTMNDKSGDDQYDGSGELEDHQHAAKPPATGARADNSFQYIHGLEAGEIDGRIDPRQDPYHNGRA